MTAHILMVDGDPALLAVLRLALEEAGGYQVTVCQRPFPEAREVEQLHPDLLMLDMVFDRHQRGETFLRRLRAYEGTRRIPVVMCTAWPCLITDQQEHLVQQDVFVLKKPFRLSELFALVASLLQESAEEGAVGKERSAFPYAPDTC